MSEHGVMLVDLSRSVPVDRVNDLMLNKRITLLFCGERYRVRHWEFHLLFYIIHFLSVKSLTVVIPHPMGRQEIESLREKNPESAGDP